MKLPIREKLTTSNCNYFKHIKEVISIKTALVNHRYTSDPIFNFG